MVDVDACIEKRRSSKKPETRATIDFVKMLVKGIEPPAYALRVRCSTPELHQPTDLCVCQTKNIITLPAENATPFSAGCCILSRALAVHQSQPAEIIQRELSAC